MSTRHGRALEPLLMQLGINEAKAERVLVQPGPGKSAYSSFRKKLCTISSAR